MVGVVVFASDIYCVPKDKLKDIRRGFVIFLNSFVTGLKHSLSDPIYSILCFSKKKKFKCILIYNEMCFFINFS